MLTTELEEKLKAHGAFDDSIIKDNAPPKFSDVLSGYIDEKKMNRTDIIKILNFNRSHGYQILNGTRKPTRNCLIQISLILKLDAEQINYLLKVSGKLPLYVRNIVDARVFYAVEHKMEYYEAVDFIWGRTAI